MKTTLGRRLSAFVLSLTLAALPAVLPSASTPACAAAMANLAMSASPDIVFADGKSETLITVTVRGSDGSLAPDGTMVDFGTTAGILAESTAYTLGGEARVHLVSGTEDAMAQVTATAHLGTAGGATGTTDVQFSTDKDIVAAGQTARWVRIDCSQYLIYSADDRIVEADGKHGSAHLQYRALNVKADALQYNLKTNILLARNVVLTRGHHTLTAAHLTYDLIHNTGTAVATMADNTLKTVDVSGPDFKLTPQSTDEAVYSTNTDIYQFADLYSSQIVISARAIAVDPGKTLQFRRATVYADGRKTLSMAYNIMSVDSLQPLGRQVIGINPDGIALDVPFYYHVDPQSVGTIFLRNSVEGSGDGSGPIDTSGTRPGLAIDLQHTYTMGINGSGQLLVNGITRSDWGVHWNDTQRLSDVMRGTFLVESPDHRSLFGQTDLSDQFHGFSLNLTGSGDHDPGENGYSSSSLSFNPSLNTDPHVLGHSGINEVTTLAWQMGQYTESEPGLPQTTTPVNTQTLGMRFYSLPIHPDSQTDVTDNLLVGQSFGEGRTSPTASLNLGMNRTMPLHSKLSLNYTMSYDPLYSQLGSVPTNGIEGNFYTPFQQHVTLNFTSQPSKMLSFNLTGGYGLPFSDTDLYSNMMYRLNQNWGIGAGEFFDRYLGDTYRETTFSLARRFFGRDLVMTYSTLTKHITFNFMGTTF